MDRATDGVTSISEASDEINKKISSMLDWQKEGLLKKLMDQKESVGKGVKSDSADFNEGMQYGLDIAIEAIR